MILVKIGAYETTPRILEWLSSDFNLNLEAKDIDYFRRSETYKSMIEHYRDQYEVDIVKVELASKRRRLEELSDLYNQTKEIKDYKEARNMLAQIRVEREGNGQGDVYQFNQFNALPDSVLLERQKENQKLIDQMKSRNSIVEIKADDVKSE